MVSLKNVLLVFTLSLFAFASFAQSNVKESENYKQNKQVYQAAVRYNDLSVAKDALYRLIALDPNDLSLLDSLAFMYFESGKYISSIMVCKDILAKNPKYLTAKEITAVSLQNLGLKEKALEEYESIYLMNNNINTLYQIAFLQFEMNRLKESKTSIDIILGNKELEKLKVVHTTSKNAQQEVPMKASILNLKGLIEMENGNNAEAKVNFENALKLAPDFESPKENLKKVG